MSREILAFFDLFSAVSSGLSVIFAVYLGLGRVMIVSGDLLIDVALPSARQITTSI